MGLAMGKQAPFLFGNTLKIPASHSHCGKFVPVCKLLVLKC